MNLTLQVSMTFLSLLPLQICHNWGFYGGHVSSVDNYLEDGLFSKKVLVFKMEDF